MLLRIEYPYNSNMYLVYANSLYASVKLTDCPGGGEQMYRNNEARFYCKLEINDTVQNQSIDGVRMES